MLILRPVAADDLDDFVALAHLLDTSNLPSDEGFLSERIAESQTSFAPGFRGPEGGVYVFMLEDLENGRCVGTSTIFAKHGTPDSPHYWQEVSHEERRSAGLDARFVHTKLRLRSTDDGPTEIGGLILDPAYRRHAEKCGKALSIVRFAYISAYPELFCREVIAEMLSPFDEQGRNLWWEAFGAKFTGLSFREADRLCTRNKQFIADLFPRDPVYLTLFPEEVQETIAKPGKTARAAVRILEKIGFHYLNQVDPFDGGPYYGAARDAIASVNQRREYVLPGVPSAEEASWEGPLALLSGEGEFGFRATVVPLGATGAPIASEAVRAALGVKAGDGVAVTPLP